MKTLAKIPCCLCGAQMEPNAANICFTCLRQKIDITEGISRNESLLLCKSCSRYCSAKGKPRYISAELESPELLSLCLRSVGGIGKNLRVCDAGFIWTEPHSRRVKLRVEVEKELPEYNGVVLKQNVEVEFVVQTRMCGACNKVDVNKEWSAVVQLRQHVAHKKTLLHVEEMLRKDKLLVLSQKIESKKDGLDIYFANKNDAVKLVDKVASIAPVVRKGEAKKYVSMDVHSTIYFFQFSITVEVSPICRHDCVLLPNSPFPHSSSVLVLCSKVGSAIHVLDPDTGETLQLNTSLLGKAETLLSLSDAVEFTVLDVHPENFGKDNNVQNEQSSLILEVVRSDELGADGTTYHVHSHLVREQAIKTGDLILGYDFTNKNFPSFPNNSVSVMLVKKKK